MFKNYQAFLRLVSSVSIAAIPLFALTSLTGCEQVAQTPLDEDAKNSTATGDTSSATAKSDGGTGHIDAASASKFKEFSDKALSLEKEKKFAEAAPVLQQAIDIKKQDKPDAALGKLYGNLGYDYLTAKNYSEACKAYTSAIKYVPASDPITKDYARDLDYCEHQVMNAPGAATAAKDADAASASGFAAGKSKDWSKAEGEFQKAIDFRSKLAPDDDLAQAYANLGWAYMSGKNYAKADEAYGKAIDTASAKCKAKVNYERDRKFVKAQLGK